MEACIAAIIWGQATTRPLHLMLKLQDVIEYHAVEQEMSKQLFPLLYVFIYVERALGVGSRCSC